MKLKKLFNDTLCAEYTHIAEETASYCTRRDRSTLYIYFQWSNGKTDWRNNFDFPAKPYRNMKDKWHAHRGFLKVWKVIEPYIEAEILNPDVKRIVISGYSHGAAIAVLCHEYCKFHRAEIDIKGYGFGCPRVAWGSLPATVKKRFEGFTVIRNGCDIVTHVPPAVFGYRHVGDMIHIGKSSGYDMITSHYADNILLELRDK